MPRADYVEALEPAEIEPEPGDRGSRGKDVSRRPFVRGLKLQSCQNERGASIDHDQSREGA
jgi:hypothetical protein